MGAQKRTHGTGKASRGVLLELHFKKKWDSPRRRKVFQEKDVVAHERAQRTDTVLCIQGTIRSWVGLPSEWESSGKKANGGDERQETKQERCTEARF